MTLLNRKLGLVSRAKLCPVSAFPDIVKDCPKIRNLPKIFLRGFENVTPDSSPLVLVIITVGNLRYSSRFHTRQTLGHRWKTQEEHKPMCYSYTVLSLSN